MYGGNSMHLLMSMPSRPPLGEDSYDPHEEEAPEVTIQMANSA